MAESSEEWELSKENIQPIQQGRKQKVLKVALAPHPEDLILQQRQTFEYELRTYSGEDPLSVWCKYIKWVEQNFPKGGREGHIKQLIEQCLSIFKDEKKYYDDNRFIDILLKFANMNSKPLDVYNYMYAHNIGCNSAKFFINWSWEFERLGSFKKANDVLTQGIQRRAEPFDKIKSYQIEFDMRLANMIKEGSETDNFDSENGRSAFAILKSQKRNLAPVSRVGEAVVDNRRGPLLHSRQQPQPRSVGAPVKTPFTIYNSENIALSLPVQSKSITPTILHSDIYKENEQKPSKWNKVKVKPRSQSLRMPTDVTPGFIFHCDDENGQDICTPRSVPKTSNVLSDRGRTPSPPMALFEPPDPIRKAMYPKKKVYGGAGEYSLEEIRAAEWFEIKKKVEQELLLAEQQRRIEEQSKKEEELEKKIENLTKQVELLQSNVVISAPKPLRFSSSIGRSYSNDSSEIFKIKNSEISNDKMHLNDQELNSRTLDSKNLSGVKPILTSSQNTTTNKSKEISENMLSFQDNVKRIGQSMTDTFENKCTDSTSYREAYKMVQDLYNRTLSHSVHDAESKTTTEYNLDLNKKPLPTSSLNICLQDLSEMNEVVEHKPDLRQAKDNIPFALYHDPTEVISVSNNTVPARNATKEETKENCIPLKSSLKLENEESYEEDSENIPPNGYIQETTKRELAGVLEPSKNILFIPLEEQEELQDYSDNEDALVCQPSSQYADETLIVPSNTEQFSVAQFLASTPCASKPAKRANLINSKSDNAPLTINNVSENVCSITEKKPISSGIESVDVQHFIGKAETKLIKETCVHPGLPNVLSVIMEASYENYSKSSSSSSSSVNLTKSCHLDPSSSHFGSVRKPHLKLEAFEKRALSSVLEVPDSASKVSSYKTETDYEKKEFKLYSVDFDPFDPQLSYEFLKSLNLNYKHLHKVKKSLKCVKIGDTVEFGGVQYKIDFLIAEGAYAKVYEASNPFGIHERFALKVCKNGNEWEFYVCCELQKRLKECSSLPDIKNSVMNVISAATYSDGIILVNEYFNFGTLLDVVNFYKKQNSTVPELLVMYLTREILHIISKLHELNIIHGDIKPDNFLITNNALQSDVMESLSKATTSLQLIDFGRAIDLNLYDKGICFLKTFSTTHFKCNEMKENKPWVFQLDWYGVLSCIHTMLFSEYMKVKKNNNKWEIEKKFKRYWLVSLWEPLFADFLNISECYQEPNIKPYVDMIETSLQQNSKSFIGQLARLKTSFSGNI